MKQVFHPMSAHDGTEMKQDATGAVTVTSKLMDNPEWVAERKYDGGRYILQWDEEGKVFLTSRHVGRKDGELVDKTENLRGYVYEDNADLAGIVFDGEIMVMRRVAGLWEFYKGNGSAEVNRIMLSGADKAKERLKNEDIKVVYVAYDILRARLPIRDGDKKIIGWEIRDVTDRPLSERKGVLEDCLIMYDNVIGIPKGWTAQNQRMLLELPFKLTQENCDKVLAAGYEGIMMKKLDSKYYPGLRSREWLKIKKLVSEDGIVMGVQQGTGKYKETMGALVIGQFFPLEDDDSIEHKLFAEAADGFKETLEGGNVAVIRCKDKEGKTLKEFLFTANNGVVYYLKEVCTISGMTDEERKKYWNDFLAKAGDTVEKTERGMFFKLEELSDEAPIVEFIAQEKTKARYRHPRFMRIREDKDFDECVFYSPLS